MLVCDISVRFDCVSFFIISFFFSINRSNHLSMTSIWENSLVSTRKHKLCMQYCTLKNYVFNFFLFIQLTIEKAQYLSNCQFIKTIYCKILFRDCLIIVRINVRNFVLNVLIKSPLICLDLPWSPDFISTSVFVSWLYFPVNNSF